MSPRLQLGVRAHDLKCNTLSELIHKIRGFSLQHIQFAAAKSFPQEVSTPLSLTRNLAQAYGEAFQQAGMQIEVLGCYVNIVHPDKNKQKEAIDAFKLHIQLCSTLGAKMVGTETGSLGKGYCEDNFTAEAFAAVVKATREMVDEAEQHNVIVGIEPGVNHPLYKAELAHELVHKINSKHLKIILDCANLITSSNYIEQKSLFENAIALLDPAIAVVHLKDFIIKDGKVVFVPVGEGMLNFDPILKYMKHKKPNLVGLIESTPEASLAGSIKFLHERYEAV
ncbi:sugar phosphate isomerase/epimerase [Paenibacillus turicensis]|uniref:Sugar phosphate isomerase/epimerase n=1 Tax=Paenibacillus turicensis TaxID=160487 RepID=A0ABS4FYY4_9BACL|nr:sugar phosphate isomerase/epimerase family protein [Paenibacillus turicensis]MBP1907750.1 sugar phosphate isomerase/epimerase [Paenibacillus turicensis]